MYYDSRLILPPEQAAYPPYVWYTNVLSHIECEAVSQLALACNLQEGRIGNDGNDGGNIVSNYRKVDTCGLLPHYKICGQSIEWLFERVRDRVVLANRDYFHFDLHGLWQQINFLRYLAPKEEGDVPGHYDWHQDFGGGQSSQRKLSVVIQLSDPNDYDGCRLEFHQENAYDPNKVQQGDMVIFPSWMVHRVTPITRGERRSLVSWVSGPPFR